MKKKNQSKKQIDIKNKTKVWINNDTLAYEKELKTLQIELLKLQNYVKDKGLKVLIIFEGRDAAGKGGTIKRITEHLNPRGARIVALEKPSDVERTQWYFQRYTKHLPSAGEIVIFDRSWYNRGGVEPVMNYCTQKEHKEFLHEVPEFEKMIVNSDIIYFKFYFSVSKEEQSKRFEERKIDPLKQFKISPVDERAQELWDDYTLAKYSMLLSSHTTHAPWKVVKSDKKKDARINCIKHILNFVDYDGKPKDTKFELDSNIIYDGYVELEKMEEEIKLIKKND